MNKIKYILYYPVFFAAQFAYKHSANKCLIDEDLERINENMKIKRSLIELLSNDTYFRNLFYHRLGNKGKYLNRLLPKNPMLMMLQTTNFSGG